MTNWIYQQTEPGLYTVGFYTPAGEWKPESDWNSWEVAADRVRYLSGGVAGERERAEEAAAMDEHSKEYAVHAIDQMIQKHMTTRRKFERAERETGTDHREKMARINEEIQNYKQAKKFIQNL